MKFKEVETCKKKKLRQEPSSGAIADVARISGKYEQIYTLTHRLTIKHLERSLKMIRRSNKKRTSKGSFGAEYKKNQRENLEQLQESLKNKKWKPSHANKRVLARDGKERTIYTFTLEDQIVQKALATLLGAVEEQRFENLSYAYRTNRRAQEAVKEIVKVINENQMNKILQLDIKKCFDNIDKDLLLEIIQKRIKDKNFIELLSKAIKVSDKNGSPIAGIPQGSILAPLMANKYLDHVIDKWYLETIYPEITKSKLIRYADDLIIATKTQADLHQIEQLLSERLKEFGLKINMEKRRETDLNQTGSNITFLGIEISRNEAGDKYDMKISETNITKCLTTTNPNILRGNLAYYAGYASNIEIPSAKLREIESSSAEI